MFAFAIQTFECVSTQLTLFHFKSQWIGFEFGLATISKLLIVLGFVKTIALDAL